MNNLDCLQRHLKTKKSNLITGKKLKMQWVNVKVARATTWKKVGATKLLHRQAVSRKLENSNSRTLNRINHSLHNMFCHPT